MDTQTQILFNTLCEQRQQLANALMQYAARGVWAALIDKYSDSAHFIYELLQNADDANATTVEIFLKKDGLYFKHNGTIRFTITDVNTEETDDKKGRKGHLNALTSIGSSAKLEDLEINKIGKFGIGFKSVFQYTRTPEVYDDIVSFRLNNYIVPELLETDHPWRKKGETLFYLPFNKKDKTPKVAYAEIEEKLKTLDNPILFLNHLKEISWDTETKSSEGLYSKQIVRSQTNGDIRCELVSISNYAKQKLDNIWMFTRNIQLKEGKFPVSVGYYLDDDGKICTTCRPNIYCYFPTKKTLNFCFVMHGPFALIENREFMKETEAVNYTIFQSLAKLSADALLCLRDIGIKDSKYLIDDNIFEIAPLTKYGYVGIDATWFNYFYDAFLNVLGREAIHLSTSGSYIESKNSIKADNNLRRLLSKEQISDLLYEAQRNNNYSYYLNITYVDYDYVHPNIRRSGAIEQYFNSIHIEMFYLDDFGQKFCKEFIKKQSHEWLNAFYKYLSHEGKRLVTNDDDTDDDLIYGALLEKPIIRDIDGDFVPLYDDGSPCVYILEGERLPNLSYVDPELLANKYLVAILENLGINTPCTTDIIENVIFPRYTNDSEDDSIDEEQYKNDFLTILKAFDSNKAQYFIERIQEHFPFRVHRGCFVKYRYIIYADMERIHNLISTDDSINIIDTKYYKRITPSSQQDLMNDFLSAMKFHEYLRVCKNVSSDINAFITKKEIMEIDGCCYHYTWSNGKEIKYYYLSEAKVADYILESFNKYTGKSEMSKDYSLFVWDSLCQYNVDGYPFKDYLNAIISFQPYDNHRYNRRNIRKESTFIRRLKQTAWIYNKEGKPCKADNIYIEDLDDAYRENNGLYALLGLQHSPQEQDWKFVQENCSEVTQGDLRLGQALRQRGINVEDENELDEFATEFAKRKQQKAEAEALRKHQAAEKAKLDLLKKEQTHDDVPRHKQTEYSSGQLFDTPANNPTTSSRSRVDVTPTISAEELIELQEQENARRSLISIAEDESRKYTFAWFNALLELEFQASDEASTSSRGINLVFSKVEKDPNSDRGILLRNPSRYIPRALEDMENISVTFYLPDNLHITISFEVASVQDYVLRLKCKNEDLEQASDLLEVAYKVYRAEIKTSSPIKLISELQTSFRALNFDDDYSLLYNLNEKIKFVFGPPGTGKTTHLVQKWIKEVARLPRAKMLILCPTNKAADVIAKRAFEMVDSRACPENWLYRFVATAEDTLDNHVCTRDSNIIDQPKCCIISTIARFAYDGFNGKKLKDIDWDYIIIDEASMIPLAEIVYLLYRCSSAQIVVAGDPFQIEPIVSEERWKDENIYTMIQLNDFSDPKTVPVQFDITPLNMQYRAVPSIGRLFSEYAYNGGVSSNREQSSQRKLNIENYNAKSVNFVMFPVDYYSIFEPHKIGNSPIHIYSALFTYEFVKYIAQNIEKQQDDKPWRIGVISPYRAQAEVINKLWEQRTELYKNVEVSVGTVHGFQGDECDIIIAVYNPPVSGLKRAADRTFVNKKNILNVAISRAQDYLFILMPDKDFEHFDKLETKTIGYIAEKDAKEMTTITSQKLEQIIFNDVHFIEKNTFVTTHQLANVYTAPASLYEVRFDDKSVDIQMQSPSV